MCEQFFNDTLRITVSQICQTIGYSSSQATSLEVLQDTLHKFLHELSRDLRRQVEHGNRTEANLNDAWRTLKNLGVHVNDIMDYMNNVEPVSFANEIPKYPIKKNSNLNFLKPGSKEVLTRPVHIYEYLPPVLPVEKQNLNNFATTSNLPDKINNLDASIESRIDTNLDVEAFNDEKPNIKLDLHKVFVNKPYDCNENILSTIVPTLRLLDEEGKPTREIRSVVMTSGGFLSPAIEGKLPEAIMPNTIEQLQGLDDTPVVVKSRPPSRCFLNESAGGGGGSVGGGSGGTALNVQSGDKTEKQLNLQLSEKQENVFKSESFPLGAAHLGLENSNGTIANNNSLININTNAFTKKSNVASTSSQPPTIASRLLKKAKRKNNNSVQFSVMQGKIQRLENQIINKNGKELNLLNGQQNEEKAYKKYLKILQKISKSTKQTNKNNDLALLMYTKKKFNEPLNPNLIANMPMGPERLQMEKLLKKQMRYKQKIMKKQIEKDLQKQMLENMKQQKDTNNFSTNEERLQPFDTKMLRHNQEPPDIEAQNPLLTHRNAMYPETLFQIQNAIQNSKESNLLQQKNQEIKREKGRENMKIFNPLNTGMKSKIEPPDRNKLNIFKKISKQKTNKFNLLNDNSNLIPNQIFNTNFNKNQVINLPTGTTITPAPAPSPSPASASVTLGLNENVLPTAYKNFDVVTNEHEKFLPQNFAVTNEMSFSTQNVKNKAITEPINVPKKRGRKPGSKNQVKQQQLNLTTTTITNVDIKANKKKQRKAKLMQNINNNNNVLANAAENSGLTEPLNLSNPNQFIVGANHNFATTIKYQQQQQQQQTQMKPKERKKLKLKNSLELINTNTTTTTTTTTTSPHFDMLKVPTKEEVNNINKKLSLIDTELKPETTTTNNNNFANVDFSNNNTNSKCAQFQQNNSNLITNSNSTKLSGSFNKKSNSQLSEFPNNISAMSNVKQQTFLPQNSGGGVGGGFSNFSGKMPVMPFYPFSAQPGLIPTPGLFGTTNLKNLTNHVNDVPANMLLTRFLPYTPFKQTEDLNSKGIRNDEQNSKISPTFRTGGDLTYCNVAPLIPETMNLSTVGQTTSNYNRQLDNLKMLKNVDILDTSTLTEIKTSATEKIKENRNAIFLRKDTEISPKMKQNFCEELEVPLNTAVLSHSLKMSEKINNNNNKNNNNNDTNNTFTKETVLSKTNHLDIVQQHAGGLPLPLLNMSEPIEVSDESLDEQNAGQPPPKQQSSGMQKIPPILYNPNIPYDNFVGANRKTDINDLYARDTKKSKKIKQIKNKPFSNNPSNIILDVFNGGENIDIVGKLAGGADLIPVAGTGMAYSSKTIPSTSLTASTATTSVFKNNLGAAVSPIKNFANVPSTTAATTTMATSETTTTTAAAAADIDLQKKRKEHKKLKKIKEGKIKKKKDKKDKTKNKLKMEKLLNIETKLLKEKSSEKDILKKFKKDKRKEKQRLMPLNPLITSTAPTTSTATNNDMSENNTNKQPFSEKLKSELPLKLITNTTEQPPTNLLPRLTLKLGNCITNEVPNTGALNVEPPTIFSNILEKREPSPELARISPLVTRPPKQKCIIGENVQNSSIGTTSTGNKTILDSVSDNKMLKTTNKSTLSHPIVPPPSPWLQGGTITASSVLLPQQLSQLVKSNDNLPITTKVPKLVQDEQQTILEANNTVSTITTDASRPSSYIDAEGNRVWICPACGKVDDGSAMIGCDGCDAWYHWICVGIFIAPKENEDWFCRVCITRKKTFSSGGDKKRKRNKKK